MEQVVQLANQIAREYEQDYVGTEHLLLAILREGSGGAYAFLHGRGITEQKARAVVDRLMAQAKEDTWVLGRLPGSPHFKNVIALAIEEARRHDSKEVETEHLLLALLKEDGSAARRTLDELKVRSADLLKALAGL